MATAYELLVEHGPRELTFERLGKAVGLVPAALVRRFKNKRMLFLAIDQYALERTNELMDNATSDQTSPIATIIAGFVTELAFATTINRFVNGQQFLLMDFSDPDLYANYQVSFEKRHRQTVALLQKAREKGELGGTFDADELARHLELILHGAGHVWAMTQKGSIEHYISHHVEFALAPYRNATKS